VRLVRLVRKVSYQAWAVLGALAVTVTVMSCPPTPEPPATPEKRVLGLVGPLDRFQGGASDRWPDLILSEIRGGELVYISPVNGAVLSERTVKRMRWWPYRKDFSVVRRCGECVLVRWRVPDMYFIACLAEECLERSWEGRKDPWRICSAILAFSYKESEARELFQAACEGTLKPVPWRERHEYRRLVRERPSTSQPMNSRTR